jgi:hypothetical protein
MSSAAPDTLQGLRRLMLAVVVLGLAGTLTDLIFLKHYESGWQIAPIVLLALLLGAAAWLALGAGSARVHCFRFLAALGIAAGITGMLLHYRGGMEFQTETYPDLAGWKLFLKVVSSKSPPALAPAAMVQIGLFGLLATYRHPALPPRDSSA